MMMTIMDITVEKVESLLEVKAAKVQSLKERVKVVVARVKSRPNPKRHQTFQWNHILIHQVQIRAANKVSPQARNLQVRQMKIHHHHRHRPHLGRSNQLGLLCLQ
jgi:hypothetical protein